MPLASSIPPPARSQDVQPAGDDMVGSCGHGGQGCQHPKIRQGLGPLRLLWPAMMGSGASRWRRRGSAARTRCYTQAQAGNDQAGPDIAAGLKPARPAGGPWPAWQRRRPPGLPPPAQAVVSSTAPEVRGENSPRARRRKTSQENNQGQQLTLRRIKSASCAVERLTSMA